jgi:type IV secretory pathway TrbF-like protein
MTSPLRFPVPTEPPTSTPDAATTSTEPAPAAPAAPPPVPPVTIDPTFNAAKRLYAEQFGDAIVTNTYLKIAVAALSLICMALVLTQLRVAKTIAGFQPLVIRVDTVGRAEAVRYGDMAYVPQEPEVKYFLGEFCRLYYSRNRESLAQNFRRSLAYLSPSLAESVLSAWERNHVVEEYQRSSLGDIDVDIVGVSITQLHEAPYQARVDFQQIYYATRERTEGKRVLYSAHFTFRFHGGTLPSQVLASNPLGLLVDYFKEDVITK